MTRIGKHSSFLKRKIVVTSWVRQEFSRAGRPISDLDLKLTSFKHNQTRVTLAIPGDSQELTIKTHSIRLDTWNAKQFFSGSVCQFATKTTLFHFQLTLIYWKSLLHCTLDNNLEEKNETFLLMKSMFESVCLSSSRTIWNDHFSIDAKFTWMRVKHQIYFHHGIATITN